MVRRPAGGLSGCPRVAFLDSARLVTTLSEAPGEVGSNFAAFGREFVIVDVTQLPLGLVAAILSTGPRGSGPEKLFIEYWRHQMYPETEYAPDETVYLHVFRNAGQ
jgi:hypothetical protein